MSKVLVIRPGAMGDVCMAVPLLEALHRECELHWLVRRAYVPLVRRLAPRLRVIAADLGRLADQPERPPFSEFQVAELRSRRFDAILDFSHWPEIARLVAELDDVPLRAITFDPAQDERLHIRPDASAEKAFNRHVAVEGLRHQSDKWRALIGGALRVHLSPMAAPPFRLAAHERLRIFVHPHAGKPDKIWPTERWLTVLAELSRRHPVHYLINSGCRHEFPRALALWLRLRLRGVPTRMLWKDRSFTTLATMLGRCDLALGSDSGPMHLASLLAVPTVVLYGPYSAREFRPWWHTWAVEPRRPGQSVDAVSASAVLAAAEALIAAVRSGSHVAAA